VLTSTAPDGNVAGATGSFTTTYTSDPAGDALTVTDPLGDHTTNVYDADHNLVSTTTPMSETTTDTYDADNELIRTTQPISTTAYGYDADGNRTSVTDGNGHLTSYAFADPALAGTVTSQTTQPTSTCPAGCTTTYTHDRVGNPTVTTDPSGRTTTEGYDAANELVSVAYSGGTTPNLAFAYGPDGQLSSQADTSVSNFSRAYSYDSLDRLAATSDVVGSGAGARTTTVSYAYDLDNRVTPIRCRPSRTAREDRPPCGHCLGAGRHGRQSRVDRTTRPPTTAFPTDPAGPPESEAPACPRVDPPEGGAGWLR
jgi:YD repeat-containing protein